MYETTCSHCGCVLEDGEVLIFQEDVYCADCLQELTMLCHHCGKRIHRQDNEGNAETPLCGQCYSRYYVTCERCGMLIQEEDAYYESDDDDTPYCYHCHQDNKTIHNYYYKPEPIFYGSGPRYFGVELEVDGAGESYSNGKCISIWKRGEVTMKNNNTDVFFRKIWLLYFNKILLKNNVISQQDYRMFMVN